MTEEIIYRGKNGVVVTRRFLRTKFKDMSLAPVTALRINRDPLFIGFGIAGGLVAFACGFADLLWFHELLTIGVVTILVLVGGYSMAGLEIGSLANSNAVLWATIWEVYRVRNAIVVARHGLPDVASVNIDISEPAE